MQEQLISFETAKLAKEKGFKFDIKFDEIDKYEHGFHIFAQYHNDITRIHSISVYDYDHRNYSAWIDLKIDAPTQSLLQKWLREMHNLTVYVDPIKYCIDKEEGEKKYFWDIYEQPYGLDAEDTIFYDNYEGALEAGLFEALKLI